MKRKQSGFTLIEIAIVLVIIGLLLGGVLKGQELINSAKVKNLATDFKNVPLFIYGYQDKYKALPGDDSSAAAHLGASAVAGTGGTLGNGVIQGEWADTGTVEAHVFWQHVRLANLAAGPVDTAGDIRPDNASGGKIGLTNAAESPITGMTGSYIVCSNSIPGKFAKQLDITLDNQDTASGSLRVVAAGTTTPAAAIATASIVDDTPYLVCMGF
ncbi:MAG: prepilin-type N-terminal cleavage/methylation domain-containing protein [Gallionella sp.]|nr:prepilin-type N-terminal cleavage/methylation domain-containing protein [Gallionella sp.]